MQLRVPKTLLPRLIARQVQSAVVIPTYVSPEMSKDADLIAFFQIRY